MASVEEVARFPTAARGFVTFVTTASLNTVP